MEPIRHISRRSRGTWRTARPDRGHDRVVSQTPRAVGSRPAGPAAGALLGLVAGALVFAAWVNDLLLGIAVAGVIFGLTVCVLAAGPGWQRFGMGLLVGAVVSLAAWSALFYASGSLGS